MDRTVDPLKTAVLAVKEKKVSLTTRLSHGGEIDYKALFAPMIASSACLEVLPNAREYVVLAMLKRKLRQVSRGLCRAVLRVWKPTTGVWKSSGRVENVSGSAEEYFRQS